MSQLLCSEGCAWLQPSMAHSSKKMLPSLRQSLPYDTTVSFITKKMAHGNGDMERSQEGAMAILNSVAACAGLCPAHRGHSTVGVDGQLLLGGERWNLFFIEDIAWTLVALFCSHVRKEVEGARCVITMAGGSGASSKPYHCDRSGSSKSWTLGNQQ